MTLILTFLGKGGMGRSTVAIAAAQKLTNEGKRVLLLSQEAGPALSMMLGTAIAASPTAVGPDTGSDNDLASGLAGGFQAVQLQTTTLLEENWEKLKKFEAQYLRDPFFKAVFGQELSVIPGMDDFLALNAIREYTESNQYDVIVHDGAGDQSSLRLWGAIGGVDWYFRRFKQVFQSSQFYKSISPFVSPITGAVFSSGLSGDIWNQPEAQGIESMVAKGKALVRDPMQLRAYVVTSDDEVAIATGQYLWSAAQQIGLTVAGTFINAGRQLSVDPAAAIQAFDPLPAVSLPHAAATNRWQPLIDALPTLDSAVSVPSAMSVDVAASTVKLFLPSFDKTQVKLTQYGPDVTVEAGDQRHNVSLPSALNGRKVIGAKFQSGYLIISFG